MGLIKCCCVGGCSATNETHRLFVFPKNDKLRNLWLSFLVPTNSLLIGLSKDQLLRRRVCEKHFDKQQFDAEGRRLRYSYPCLFADDEIAHGVPLYSPGTAAFGRSGVHVDEFKFKDQARINHKTVYKACDTLSDHNYYKESMDDDDDDDADTKFVIGRAGEDFHEHPLCSYSQPVSSLEGQRGADNIHMHCFPNPDKDPDRFRSWVYAVGGDILKFENMHIFKQGRVCHKHFESKYHTWTKTLSPNAVPTLCLQKKAAECSVQDGKKPPSPSKSVTPPPPSSPDPTPSSPVAGTCEVDTEPLEPAAEDDDIFVSKVMIKSDSKMSSRILPQQKLVWIKTKGVSENVRACRACLATNMRLFDLEDNIKSTYEEFVGSPVSVSDNLPKYLCTYCMVLLRKFKNFKEKCLRAQELLHNIDGIKMLNTKFIKSVDRPFYNLHNNLSISSPVFMETDYIKEEIDLLDEEPVVVKQENQLKTLDETKPEDINMEEVLDYVMDDEQYLEESEGEAEPKQQKNFFDREAYEIEYNMDITLLTEEEQILEIEARKQSQNFLKSNFRCEDCGKGFNSNETFTTHYNTIHHPSLGQFECQLCKSRFSSKIRMNAHIISHKYRYNCRECEFTTMRRCSASKHRDYHMGVLYTCHICKKDFAKHTSLLSHTRIHHPAQGVWCRYCGESFISEIGLKTHRRLKHANMITEFECQACGDTFLYEDALTVHNSDDCAPNPCAFCGYSYSSDRLLQNHVLEVHRGKVVKSHRPQASQTAKKAKRKDMKKCELCDNMFNSETALERHSELMEGACGGMRACVECGESFLTGDMLKEHVIDHHSEVEMLCPRCNRTFESESDFNEHYKRVHMKKGPPRLIGTKTWGVTVLSDGPVIAEKAGPEERDPMPVKTKSKGTPSFCEVCGKQCASSVHLTYHLRMHTGEKPYKCAICQKAFAVPKFLKEHFKVHTGERPFDCEFCSKAFKSKSALNRHKLIHTGERRHICSICSKDFLTSSDVKTHIKTVHMKIVGPPRIRKPRVERELQVHDVQIQYINE